MLKKVYISLLLICAGIYNLYASPLAVKSRNDTLIKIVNIQNKELREKRIVFFVKGYLQDSDTVGLTKGKNQIESLLNKYNEPNKEAFIYFTESIYQRRFLHLDSAENLLLKAIRATDKNQNHYLQYIFLTHLAFLQTDKGDATSALVSYGLAKKEASQVKDPKLQIIIDINMSDLYYKIGFYSQSITVLNDANDLTRINKLNEKRYFTLIYYNLSENYFRMGLYDSLKVYNQKLKGPDNQSYKLYTYQVRTDYYLLLLKHDYRGAIKLICQLMADKRYVKSDVEPQRLAEAYYYANQLDSARILIDTILAAKTEINHPEVKANFYNILGEIAERDKNTAQAAQYYKMALAQETINLNNFMKVGSISAQIKADEIESAYTESASKLKKERLLLLLVIVIVVSALAIILLLYRSIRQKRHYEQLLFANTKEELGYINSHEVRIHLSNIIGLLDVMRQSDTADEEFLTAREHLLESAEKLDDAIKNLSEKLSEE